MFVLDLTQIVALSTDWDELLWAWDGWRRESGANMPNMYEEFAALQNLAATMNGEDLNNLCFSHNVHDQQTINKTSIFSFLWPGY